jgi:hypothetical protein
VGIIVPTLPTVGQSRGGEEVDVLNVLTALLNEFNGSIDAANIADGVITAAELATAAKPATLLGAYRSIAEATWGVLTQGFTGLFVPTLGTPVNSGVATSSSLPQVLLPFDPAAYTVSGLAAKLRVVASTAVSTVTPAASFTYGLHPVSAVSGGTGLLIVTLGAAVAGSTVVRTTPAAGAAYQDASADFAVPSAGVYALGVNISAPLATNAAVAASARLEVHHV